MIHSLSFYTYVTFRQQIYIIPNGFLIVKKKCGRPYTLPIFMLLVKEYLWSWKISFCGLELQLRNLGAKKRGKSFNLFSLASNFRNLSLSFRRWWTQRPGVNFINIIWAAFLYASILQNFSVPTICVCIFRQKEINKKCCLQKCKRNWRKVLIHHILFSFSFHFSLFHFLCQGHLPTSQACLI